MSRVTTETHLGRHDLLIVAWDHIPELYGLLSPAAQWEVHRLYAPSQDLSDEQVLAHIKQAQANEPLLAQRVGKHYHEVFDAFKFYADQVGKTEWEFIGWLVRMEHRRDHAELIGKQWIDLWPLVNPDLDPAKLARLFIELAQREARDKPEQAG